MMMAVYTQTTLMVAIVQFSPQTYEGGGRVHVMETWIFASEDGKHDCDFHLHALARIADHYLHGEGSEATAAARRDGRVPRIHMFTDGCAKQYKGRRNFRFLANSLRQIGFFVDHHFAATSHFKACHDGICGIAKNTMKHREKFGVRIVGADGVVRFLESFFREQGGGGEEGMRKYFSTWSPYRVRRIHVKLIGPSEICRPELDLKGVEGTHSMYHFQGENIPQPVGATTTEEMVDDWKAVAEVESGIVEYEESGEVKKLTVLKAREWVTVVGVGAGKEEVDVRKMVRNFHLKTRLASCFCSSCRLLQYEACHVNMMYPGLVPKLKDGAVQQTVVMDTGVAVEGQPSGIKFGRKRFCGVERITGTEWKESEQAEAKALWDAL